MEKLKVGQIDYLNCYPFYYYMDQKKPLNNVDVFKGYPSDLNSKMESGGLDLSPVSAGALGALQGKVDILPEFCLSSVGYVRSVILISKYPIEELDQKLIGLTVASKTSITMMKILLQRYYNIKPQYVESAPNPSLKGLDAAVVIGNDAMLESSEPIPYTYDLGDLWLRKTGHRVVFAVFTVQKGLSAEKQRLVKEVRDSYRRSLGCLTTEREDLIKQAALLYPEVHYDIDEYYNLLQFDFSARLKLALEFFLQQAGELGLIPAVNEIEYQ